jgi:hypothetical protein
MRLSKHAEQLVTEFLVDFFKALDENPEIQVAYTDGDPYINITGLTGNGTFLTSPKTRRVSPPCSTSSTSSHTRTARVPPASSP